MKIEFSWQSFEQQLNIKFMKILQWEPRRSNRIDRRTGGRDEANSRFSLFCERH